MRVERDRLDDRLLVRSFELEGAAVTLAPLLDGASEWSAIRARVVARGNDGEDVDLAMRRLLLLHAVEGAGDAMVAKLERVLRHEEAVPISILDGARFGCQGSGGCCQGYRFGPLADSDVAALDALDLAAAFPHVAPPYLETHAEGRYLRRDGDRCIFLTGEKRCGLHAAFGADAKPRFCRLFPLDSFGTVEGIRIVDRGTCATFAISARVGLPLVDDLERVRPIMNPTVLHHPVALVDGWAWDYAIFLRFTTAATTLVRCNLGTASETLLAIGRCLDAMSVATQRCPIGPEQPDAIVGAVLAVDGASWYRPPRGDAVEAGTRELVALLRALALASAEWYRELALLIEQTITAVADDDPAPPASPAAEVDEALRISMRQQLFGRHLLVHHHAGVGLVRIGLIQLLALAGARIDAGARAITAADLNRGHVLAARALESGKLDDLLAEHEPHWRALLDGLAGAARVLAG